MKNLILTKTNNIDPILKNVPPHDLYAEEAVLSAIFADNTSLLEVVDIISSKDFYKKIHQRIYLAIFELFSQDQPIDFITVSSRLKQKQQLEEVGGSGFISSFIDSAPIAIDIAYYAKIIKDKSLLRFLMSTVSLIIERSLKDKGDFDDIIDFAESSIFNISESKNVKSFSSISDLIQINVNMLEERQAKKGSLLGLTTGNNRYF